MVGLGHGGRDRGGLGPWWVRAMMGLGACWAGAMLGCGDGTAWVRRGPEGEEPATREPELEVPCTLAQHGA